MKLPDFPKIRRGAPLRHVLLVDSALEVDAGDAGPAGTL